MMVGTLGETRYPNAPRPDTIETGNSFEDFVCDELSKMGIILRTYKSKDYQYKVGESRVGWEIKYDEGCLKYGHLSIEVAERTKNESWRPWVDSGILRNDNTWLYIQGNFKCFWILFKPVLLHYYKKRNPEVTEKFGTIKTFYLEFDLADACGMRVEP